MSPIFSRYVILSLIALIVFSVLNAAAAGISVPSTRLAELSSAITANSLKPPACAGLNLSSILVCPAGGGNCDGTDASELILGSATIDNISGGKGDDCILGGGGIDAIRGDQDTDICIGGPDLDAFHPSCETQIQ